MPRYIAASIIAMYPEHFGFSPMNYQPVKAPDIVKVSDCISLSVIANYSNVSLDTLKFLNPELKRDVTPPGYKDYELKVPSGTGEIVASSIASIPATERLYFLVHKTTRNQPLSRIAKAYNVHPSSIKQINGLASATVPKGKVLFIPTSAMLAAQTSYSLNELSDESREGRKRHRISKKKLRRPNKRYTRAQKRHRKSISSTQASSTSNLTLAVTTP
ncbi:MAG: LysM peptidoglycan-binding domain-containing protein [Chlorobiales bacterium]|nr:LysM peptidoglycan-binding domain-containing protein [Chlorobiales bacterium]